VALDAIDSVPLERFPALDRDFVTFYPTLDGAGLIKDSALAGRQEVFPVIDQAEKLVGLVTLEDLTLLAAEPALQTALVNAADIMRQPIMLDEDDNVRTAYELLVSSGLREIPVVNAERHVIGLIDEVAIAHAYMQARWATVGTAGVRDANTPPDDTQ
jgi:CIC family chloride channel protein